MHVTQTCLSSIVQKPDLTSSSATFWHFIQNATQSKLKTFFFFIDPDLLNLSPFCLNWRGQYVLRKAFSPFSATGHRRLEHLIVFWLERKSSWLTDRVWSRSMPSLERVEAQGGKWPADWEPQDLGAFMLWLSSGVLYLLCPCLLRTEREWSHLTAMSDISLPHRHFNELKKKNNKTAK